MVQESSFCGRGGVRTIFQIKAGGRGYKISPFSDYPQEAEVLIPILSRFMVLAAMKLMKVCLGPQDDEESVKTDDFKKSDKHRGDPDVVILSPLPASIPNA